MENFVEAGEFGLLTGVFCCKIHQSVAMNADVFAEEDDVSLMTPVVFKSLRPTEGNGGKSLAKSIGRIRVFEPQLRLLHGVEDWTI